LKNNFFGDVKKLTAVCLQLPQHEVNLFLKKTHSLGYFAAFLATKKR